MRSSPRLPATIEATPAEAEEALLARAQRDPHAFAPLYEAYFDAVYRYCYHRLGDWADAEDAASLVFATALAALPRYRVGDRDGTFRSWLFAIAHNAVANHRRRRARHPEASLAMADGCRDTGPSPEEQAIAAETHRTVRDLLGRLPEDQRRLLELRLAGLNDAEIARAVGRNHGAVRQAQFRAVSRLRALLGIAPGGEGGADG
jgi:RNA polymerase sigma-70 factor, ECF subfamily